MAKKRGGTNGENVLPSDEFEIARSRGVVWCQICHRLQITIKPIWDACGNERTIGRRQDPMGRQTKKKRTLNKKKKKLAKPGAKLTWGS